MTAKNPLAEQTRGLSDFLYKRALSEGARGAVLFHRGTDWKIDAELSAATCINENVRRHIRKRLSGGVREHVRVFCMGKATRARGFSFSPKSER